MKNSKLVVLFALLGIYAIPVHADPIWTEEFDTGVGRFDEIQLGGNELFTWDAPNQRMLAEFRRDGAASRRLADVGGNLNASDVFGFSAVVTPLERNTSTGTPNLNVEGHIGFFDSTGNSRIGIKVRDSGFGGGNFGLFGLPNLPGDGPISWQRFSTYYIEFMFDGSASQIAWSVYEGVDSTGTNLGNELYQIPAGTNLSLDRLAMSTAGLDDVPGPVDAYLRAGIDDVSFIPEPSTAMLLIVGAFGIGYRTRRR